MKKVVITKAGTPDVLQVQEAPDPTPQKGEVLIDVKATGINFADILARQGLYPDAPKTPCVVGYEVSGIITAVGEGGDASQIGKEVLALTRFNGYATHVCVPEVQVFDKPAKLSFEQAATIPVNYLTAWALIVVMGNLQSDESMLVHNAGSGVGLAAIDIANHIGATVYGTASAGKHDFLKEKGYHHLIDYRTTDWFPEMKALTNRRGVELVLDPTGGKNWKKSYRILRHTGKLGMFGMASISASGVQGKLNLAQAMLQTPFFHPFHLLGTNRSVFGLNLGHLWGESEKVRKWALALLEGVEKGWINPYVDATFPLEEAAEAHRFIEARKSKGKVILTF